MAHSSSQSWCNWVRFVGLLARTRFFSSAHTLSIRLRSGLCDGHSNTLTLLSLSHFATTLEVCLGSLSIWKTHLPKHVIVKSHSSWERQRQQSGFRHWYGRTAVDWEEWRIRPEGRWDEVWRTSPMTHTYTSTPIGSSRRRGHDYTSERNQLSSWLAEMYCLSRCTGSWLLLVCGYKDMCMYKHVFVFKAVWPSGWINLVWAFPSHPFEFLLCLLRTQQEALWK